jgi:hypothetical protein
VVELGDLLVMVSGDELEPEEIDEVISLLAVLEASGTAPTGDAKVANVAIVERTVDDVD